jgi:hypothetical protein
LDGFCRAVCKCSDSAKFGLPEREKSELQFEINDQLYFVNFLPSEGRWYLFTSTEGGMIKIPVAMDAAPFENFAVSPEEGKAPTIH